MLKLICISIIYKNTNKLHIVKNKLQWINKIKKYFLEYRAILLTCKKN